MSRPANQFADGGLDSEGFKRWLVSLLYKTGLVGLKMNTTEKILWSYRGERSIDPMDISATTRMHVHKLAWRALGISG